jgi:type III secretion protein V
MNRALAILAQRADLVLALLIVATIFMMILPLPTLLVDTLIALNMGIAAILLMVSMYLPNPLAFSSFPTVLLVTTLFRLALSISTTRLVLLDGYAGEIINTFGNFVIGGNLVVGLVVFMILTIVQFIVITKGAERVAEVGARFSLDAMPGKQMSIDGDMRAGVIDQDEARRRREIVQKESQLYGAMDGAMKFVKGDAIAGLIIVGVNLLGGMTIGVLQKGLTASEAIKVYSLLTIGDGLIGQIPALFISITAGIIVTRVSAEGGSSNIGQDIGTQIMAHPRALLIGAGILMLLGVVPGMPTAIFAIIAFSVALLGYTLHRGAREVVDQKTGKVTTVPAMAAAGEKPKARAEPTDDFAPTVPLLMDVASPLQTTFSAEVLNEELLKVRRALYFDLGVPFPGIQLRFNDRLPTETYAILLAEVPVSQGRLRPGYLLVREDPDNLKALQVPFETDKKFLPNLPTIWVQDSLRDTLAKAACRSWIPRRCSHTTSPSC